MQIHKIIYLIISSYLYITCKKIVIEELSLLLTVIVHIRYIQYLFYHTIDSISQSSLHKHGKEKEDISIYV